MKYIKGKIASEVTKGHHKNVKMIIISTNQTFLFFTFNVNTSFVSYIFTVVILICKSIYQLKLINCKC